MKTPQEIKAEELVAKMYADGHCEWYVAIQCAKIAVEREIATLESIWVSHCDDNNIAELFNEAKEVLNCLNKL